MKLVDLEPDDPRLASDVYPVLRQLRTDLTRDGLAGVYREGHPLGLRFLAAYRNERCVGVAGWRVIATTAGIRKLYVDDLVTDAHERGTGVGAALLAELRTRGAARGCRLLDLDSGVQRGDAHRFYMREGMAITSFHFAQALTPPPHTPTE
jgi:GNAT superfamily N-acetyltransferase